MTWFKVPLHNPGLVILGGASGSAAHVPVATPFGHKTRSIKLLHKHFIEGAKHYRVEGAVLKATALEIPDSVDVCIYSLARG